MRLGGPRRGPVALKEHGAVLLEPLDLGGVGANHLRGTDHAEEIVARVHGEQCKDRDSQGDVRHQGSDQPRIQEFAMGGAVYQRGGNVCEAV